jgi:hypothetical protein
MKRSRRFCGVGINMENPAWVRPTRELAWMNSSIAVGMPDLRAMADLLNSLQMTALYDRVSGTASVSLKTLMSMKLPALGPSSRPQRAA